MKTRIAIVIFLTAVILSGMWHVQPIEAQIGTPCDRTVAISVAAAASQTIAAAVSGQVVSVCAFSISADTIATTGTFVSGSTSLTGAMRMCDECNITAGNGSAVLFATPGGGALTISAVTGAITGYARIGQR